MKVDTLRAEFVKYIPEKPEDGVLYVSMDFAIAVHNCCCGCGIETVTPLGPDGWQILCEGPLATLHPSIGNFQMPCKSHYWIEAGKVRWA